MAMKKRYGFTLIFCSFILTNNIYSQSNAIPNFRFEEDATIHLSNNYTLNTNVAFAVYDSWKIVVNNGKPIGYGAYDVIEFYLKKSDKKFLSASASQHSTPEFVEDLTQDHRKLKVVKSFTVDQPFTRKDSIVMGKWSHHFLLMKDDGSRRLISSFTKIAEFVTIDCPELSQKILSNQKGYTVETFKGDLGKELEVYKRIASEFERCKR